MGRAPRISDADLVAAATRVAARLGPARATVDLIAREAGVPVGSVYHRVPSRAALMAEVWIAAADSFGADVIARLDAAKTVEDVLEAALVTPRFVRADPAAGVVLFTNRREDFLADAPAPSKARAAALTSALQDAIAGAACHLLPGKRRGRELVAVAILGIPYGAVRIFLPQAVPPPELDSVIIDAARGALAYSQ
jgi:AcrR family transcriptional regulator